MSSHRIQKNWKAKLKAAVPFGLGQAKLKHFRDMVGIAGWEDAKVLREQIEKSWRRALKTWKLPR